MHLFIFSTPWLIFQPVVIKFLGTRSRDLRLSASVLHWRNIFLPCYGKVRKQWDHQQETGRAGRGGSSSYVVGRLPGAELPFLNPAWNTWAWPPRRVNYCWFMAVGGTELSRTRSVLGPLLLTFTFGLRISCLPWPWAATSCDREETEQLDASPGGFWSFLLPLEGAALPQERSRAQQASFTACDSPQARERPLASTAMSAS